MFRAFVLCLFPLLTLCATQNSANAGNNAGVTPALKPLTTCIDDSDCQKLGEGFKFRCFMYICYPWKDDSHLSTSQRRDSCRKDDDCDTKRGQECFRHHDKRTVTSGLCFDQINYCDTPNDCSSDFGCCGGYCCEQEYYQQFANLPCVSDLGCVDLGLGKYCCPRSNGTNVCCDENPHPAPTQAPSVGDGANVHTVAVASLAATIILAISAITC